jgi:methylated-DNA-[protein]-cysteine S-methyltransferase
LLTIQKSCAISTYSIILPIFFLTLKNMEITPAFHRLRRTRFGPVAVLWSVHQGQPKIRRVLLSNPGLSAKQTLKSLFPDSNASSCAKVDALADRIAAFLTGENLRFSLEVARLDLCSPFQQQVLRAEHGIPRGRVSTYQRIAGHLGHPRAARAVGTALAHNPFPIIVPCRRAIRSDGTLGGFQGGVEMKRALAEEGMGEKLEQCQSIKRGDPIRKSMIKK